MSISYILDYHPPKAAFEIQHGDKIALLGSCFSDSMKIHFEIEGFETNCNPFGTIFHPHALANCLKSSLHDNIEIDFYLREDLYFSWDTASHIYGMSEKSITEKLIEIRASTKAYLTEAKVLIITFGTAWGYLHHELNKVVANCHKADQALFDKKISSSSEIVVRWRAIILDLKILNPDLQIIFTVSPVRHVKDGLIENNRSKSRLIEAVHELTLHENVSYFPSYEIVIDQLRDYRFYAIDHVHPSQEAVEIVWSAFRTVYFSESTMQLGEKVAQVNRSLAHRPLHPDSIGSREHKERTREAKKKMALENPEIYWT